MRVWLGTRAPGENCGSGGGARKSSGSDLYAVPAMLKTAAAVDVNATEFIP